jgi:hypothetical protein
MKLTLISFGWQQVIPFLRAKCMEPTFPITNYSYLGAGLTSSLLPVFAAVYSTRINVEMNRFP